LLLAFTSRVILCCRSCRTCDHIFLIHLILASIITPGAVSRTPAAYSCRSACHHWLVCMCSLLDILVPHDIPHVLVFWNTNILKFLDFIHSVTVFTCAVSYATWPVHILLQQASVDVLYVLNMNPIAFKLKSDSQCHSNERLKSTWWSLTAMLSTATTTTTTTTMVLIMTLKDE
jgi:hypothetical protein